MSLLVDIKKTYGNFNLDVKFEAGNEVMAILGASGCGKSLTLKCIAGIEKPDKGRIVLDGKVLFDSDAKIDLKPQERMAGYLFQQYALFPNMTTFQNISCGVREKGKKIKKEKTEAMISRLHLEGCEDKKPTQLSGGQQQRCALARILVNEPDVLLLDEPFSALDAHLRFHTERQVEKIIREFARTVIFVSHDRDEVFRMTNKIAVMEDGMLMTMGEKHDVFDKPVTTKGAILTGCKNITAAKKLSDTKILAADWGIELDAVSVPDDIVSAGIRMHDVKINDEGLSDENAFTCDVIGEIENPFSYSVMLRPEGVRSDRYILIDLKKHRWEQIRAPRLDIILPSDKILLLK